MGEGWEEMETRRQLPRAARSSRRERICAHALPRCFDRHFVLSLSHPPHPAVSGIAAHTRVKAPLAFVRLEYVCY